MPVALGTKLIHLGLHPAKQLFCEPRSNPCPLKISYLSALPQYLAAHVLDLSADSRKFHECPSFAHKNIKGTNEQVARVRCSAK